MGIRSNINNDFYIPQSLARGPIIPLRKEASSELEIAKLAKVALKVLAVAILALVGNVVTLGLPLLYRYRIADKTKERTQIKIVREQLIHLKDVTKFNKAIKNEILKVDKGEKACAEALQQRALTIIERIDVCDKEKLSDVQWVENLHKDVEKVSKKLFPLVKTLKDSPTLRFFQSLITKLQTAPIVPSKLIDLKKVENLADAKNFLEKEQKKTSFRKEGIFALFWAITHPLLFFHGWAFQTRADGYDPRYSNTTFSIYRKNGVNCLIGPTPFNEESEKQITDKKLYFVHMDVCKTSELDRMQRFKTKLPKNGTFIAFGFKSKKPLLAEEDFIAEYQKRVKRRPLLATGIGTYIPKEQLNDAEIDAVFNEVNKLFEGQSFDTEKKKLAALIVIDAFLALEIIRKNKSKDELLVQIGCRQGFDRAPIFASAMMYLLERKEKNPDFAEVSKIIAALPSIRAPIYEGRVQTKPKHRVLKEVLSLLEELKD